MNASQLKSSILQLAVSGKLVPQNPNDEPAAALLERIRAEKERLVKCGKIKREKREAKIFRRGNSFYEIAEGKERCIDDEIPFEIPESWEWCRVGEIVLNLDSQRRPVTKSSRKSEYGYYDYYGATGAIDKVDDYLFDGEYLMIGEDGGNFYTSRDNSFIASGKFWANNHVHIVQPYVINIWFLKFFLDSCNLPAMGLITGIAVPKLNQRNLNSILVALPPIEEQRRIVEKLETVLPLVEKYADAEKLLGKLDADFPARLKKSVLQLAVQGKLVPQNPADEPASALLDRIRAEKDRLIAAGKIKRDKTESVIRRVGNSFYESTAKTDRPIDDELPFEIPESWEWCRFGEIVLNLDSQRRPVTKSSRKSEHGYYDYYGATGAIDKVDDYLFDGEYLMIGEDGGNFYTSRDNSFIASGKFWANNHVHIVQPYVINIWFLKFFLDSCNLPAMGLITGIAVPKLNQRNLNSILIPLPPLAEQKRIVEKIEEILPLIENLPRQ